MNLVIHPFYSQQDKKTGKFLLDTCRGTSVLSYIADAVEREFKWDVDAIVPTGAKSIFNCRSVYTRIPNYNPMQRIHWDTRELYELYEGADMVLTNHEYLSIPLRIMFPKLKIVMQSDLAPINSDVFMFRQAWDSASLVVTQSKTTAESTRQCTNTPVKCWSMAYDENKWPKKDGPRPIDVVFVMRCSSTNYTHHLEFLEAMERMPNTRFVFTDVTNYLKQQRPDLEYCNKDTYADTLYSSKIAIAMSNDGYGGGSIREACRAGCTPVVLDCRGYKTLKGAYFVYPNPTSIIEGICNALKQPVKVDTTGDSYGAQIEKVLKDLYDISN
jgi:hypothetical protein